MQVESTKVDSKDFERWFDLLWPRLRDLLAFGLGLFLLTKPSLSATQATIGAACLGLTATGITRRVLRNSNRKNHE